MVNKSALLRDNAFIDANSSQIYLTALRVPFHGLLFWIVLVFAAILIGARDYIFGLFWALRSPPPQIHMHEREAGGRAYFAKTNR